MEAFNNGFGLRIRFGIEFLMGMAIPTETASRSTLVFERPTITGRGASHYNQPPKNELA